MKKFITQMDMKQSNASEVFELIRKSAPITRKQIEDETQMSWAGVSKIVSSLIMNGYVVEHFDYAETKVGRTPAYLDVNIDDNFVLGVDINQKRFRSVIVNLKCGVVSEYSKTVDFNSQEVIVEEIKNYINEAIALVPDKKIIAIGLAIPGGVDVEDGIATGVPGFNFWHNLEIVRLLRESISIPIYIQHDPECVLIGENEHNGLDDTILVRAGHGIGLAVMKSSTLLGAPGMLELGHICVDPGGRKCACGKRGCLQQYGTLLALEQQSGMSISELAEKARGGDEDAKRMFRECAVYLSTAMATAATLFDVKNISVCGSIVKYADLMHDEAEKTIKMIDENFRLSLSDLLLASDGAARFAVSCIIREVKV